MKLVTFHTLDSQQDKVGAILGDQVLEFMHSSGRPVWTSMLELIEGGASAWDQARDNIQGERGEIHKIDEVKLRAPIPLPPQYRDAMCFHLHIQQSFSAMSTMRAKMSGDPKKIKAAELAARNYIIPKIHSNQPVYYKGNRFAVGHPNQEIVWPKYSNLMDFELELACVVGKKGKDLSVQTAKNHIFGYMILNDLSARDAQGTEMRGLLGPAKGKDFDNANVFGPWIVTADELEDPYSLAMSARVNGELWGTGNTADMFWTFEQLLAHISMGETLYPGEIIGSGTVGNGSGIENHRFLSHGDLVELEIEKIGVLKNRVLRD